MVDAQQVTKVTVKRTLECIGLAGIALRRSSDSFGVSSVIVEQPQHQVLGQRRRMQIDALLGNHHRVDKPRRQHGPADPQTRRNRL